MSLPVRMFLFGAVCGLAVLCGELIPGCSCDGAPAPLPRRDRDATSGALAGEWVMLWAGDVCPVTLRPDGTYQARWAGLQWRGTWTLRGRTFCVSETCGGSWVVWDVKLDRSLKGTLAGGGRVELRRVR